MAHKYNVKAFQIGANAGQALLSLYSTLVALELAIKDHFAAANWRQGHKLIDWVADLGEAALSQQLANALGLLFCTMPDGNEGRVNGNAYPGLRYLRHESDFAGKSNDNQLQDVLNIMADIRTELAKQGIIF